MTESTNLNHNLANGDIKISENIFMISIFIIVFILVCLAILVFLQCLYLQSIKRVINRHLDESMKWLSFSTEFDEESIRSRIKVFQNRSLPKIQNSKNQEFKKTTFKTNTKKLSKTERSFQNSLIAEISKTKINRALSSFFCMQQENESSILKKKSRKIHKTNKRDRKNSISEHYKVNKKVILPIHTTPEKLFLTTTFLHNQSSFCKYDKPPKIQVVNISETNTPKQNSKLRLRGSNDSCFYKTPTKKYENSSAVYDIVNPIKVTPLRIESIFKSTQSEKYTNFQDRIEDVGSKILKMATYREAAVDVPENICKLEPQIVSASTKEKNIPITPEDIAYIRDYIKHSASTIDPFVTTSALMVPQNSEIGYLSGINCLPSYDSEDENSGLQSFREHNSTNKSDMKSPVMLKSDKKQGSEKRTEVIVERSNYLRNSSMKHGMQDFPKYRPVVNTMSTICYQKPRINKPEKLYVRPYASSLNCVQKVAAKSKFDPQEMYIAGVTTNNPKTLENLIKCNEKNQNRNRFKHFETDHENTHFRTLRVKRQNSHSKYLFQGRYSLDDQYDEDRCEYWI